MTRRTPPTRSTTSRLAQLVEGGQHVALARHVGEEDEPGLVAQADLLHRRGSTRRGRRRPWPPRPAHRAGRPRRCSGSRRSAGRSGSARSALARFGAGAGAPARRLRDGVDEVAEHGAGRRPAAGTAAVEHELAADLALDEHGVEGAAHRRPAGASGAPWPGGPGPRRSGPPSTQLGDGQQLHRRSRAGRRRRCRPRSMPLMPSRCTSASTTSRPEGQRGQDGGLGGGVVALDVGRRVALGQTERWASARASS